LKTFQSAIQVAVVTFSFLFGFPDWAFAFTLLNVQGLGATTGWGISQVQFDIDSSCDSVAGVTQNAVNLASLTWGSIPTSVLVIKPGNRVTLSGAITHYIGSTATLTAPVGNPLIYCDTNFEADSGLGAGSGNMIPGFASSWNMTGDGKIQGALLVLNIESGKAANVMNFSPKLLSLILTHEIGHILGLGHSADSNALMYYRFASNDQLVLSKDDMDGITYLHPRKEPAVGGWMGCNSIENINRQSRRFGVISESTAVANSRSGLVEFSLIGLLLILLWQVRHKVSRYFVA
jgi:hypothetical protein